MLFGYDSFSTLVHDSAPAPSATTSPRGGPLTMTSGEMTTVFRRMVSHRMGRASVGERQWDDCRIRLPALDLGRNPLPSSTINSIGPGGTSSVTSISKSSHCPPN